MKEFIKRLSSRKFLLTVAGLVGVTLYPEQADNIVMLIGLFVGAEGVRDTVQSYSNQRYVAPKQADAAAVKALVGDDDEGVDRSKIVSGSQFTPVG